MRGRNLPAVVCVTAVVSSRPCVCPYVSHSLNKLFVCHIGYGTGHFPEVVQMAVCGVHYRLGVLAYQITRPYLYAYGAYPVVQLYFKDI